MGYEFELLKGFAKSIGVKLEIVVAKNMNEIFDLLNNNEVDIVAANLTVTKERLEIVNFTTPLLHTRQVLIQRKPKGWERMRKDDLEQKLIRNHFDLSGKNIHVRKGSSFYSRLISLSEEIGEKINIIEASGEEDTELLINKVARGDIDYTAADENVALINQTYYPNIDIETPISFSQKIAWAVRKKSPILNHMLNRWIDDEKNKETAQLTYKKYFKDSKKLRRIILSNRFPDTNQLSEYDAMIKKYSAKIGWDWRLLASMIFQESGFSPTAQSWAGAYGLMQLMPETGARYGLDTSIGNAEGNIVAGTNYILDLDKYWRGKIPDKNERIKFILASYNVGLGHVIDARNLAMKYEKNPDLWFDNVDYMILQKSNPKIYNDTIVKCGYCRGQETYIYVKEILARYEHYKSKLPEYDYKGSLVKN